MPFHRRASQAGVVTIDTDGFIVVGSGLPFKYVEEPSPDGTGTRISQVVKHPTLGEITIAFTDKP